MFSDGGDDDGLIMLFVTMTILTVVFVFFLIASLIRLKNKQIKREEELLKALIDERERTMSNISTEIHDNVNQVLSLARMSLKMISKTIVPEQKKYLDECGNILDTVIGDLRNISHSLNSEYLKKKGLIESLQEELKWINMSKNINCEMNIEGYHFMLNPDIELMLVRIAQETMQNILKHSQAQNMFINIEYKRTQFSMCIADDGIGFEIDPIAPWKGVGLQSIYERSRIVNGEISINSVIGQGTEIMLVLKNAKKIKLPA